MINLYIFFKISSYFTIIKLREFYRSWHYSNSYFLPSFVAERACCSWQYFWDQMHVIWLPSVRAEQTQRHIKGNLFICEFSLYTWCNKNDCFKIHSKAFNSASVTCLYSIWDQEKKKVNLRQNLLIKSLIITFTWNYLHTGYIWRRTQCIPVIREMSSRRTIRRSRRTIGRSGRTINTQQLRINS